MSENRSGRQENNYGVFRTARLFFGIMPGMEKNLAIVGSCNPVNHDTLRGAARSRKFAALATLLCAAASVCVAKPAAERMDRSKLLVGAYCLQANARTDAHVNSCNTSSRC